MWDVPVRLSSSDASRAVEGCVASFFLKRKGKSLSLSASTQIPFPVLIKGLVVGND